MTLISESIKEAMNRKTDFDVFGTAYLHTHSWAVWWYNGLAYTFMCRCGEILPTQEQVEFWKNLP